MKKNYDFFIKNISSNKKNPAYEAYIPKYKAVILGANFKELEKGIKMVEAFENKQSKKIIQINHIQKAKQR